MIGGWGLIFKLGFYWSNPPLLKSQPLLLVVGSMLRPDYITGVCCDLPSFARCPCSILCVFKNQGNMGHSRI